MTIQTINIGNVVNDGLGDDLRTAFQKVNANFTSLSSELTITGLNLGTTGVGLFKQRSGANLEFLRLKEGGLEGIQLDEYDTHVEITNTAVNRFTRLWGDSGDVEARLFKEVTLEGYAHADSYSGVQDISVNIIGSSVRFTTAIPVTEILTTYDFGSISGTPTNAIQVAMAWANVDFGEVELPGTIDLDCGGF